MKRKFTLAISALLILADIGVTAAVLDAAGGEFGAVLDAVETLLRDYLRPLPRLGG